MSGSNWIGELPAGWEMRRADAVLEYRKTPARVVDFQSEEVFHYSIPAIQKTGDGTVQAGSEIDSDKIRLQGGELLVSKLNPRKGCVLLAKPQAYPIVCSTEFVPLVAKPGFSSKFGYYIYSSLPVRELISSAVESVTRSHQRANPADIAKIWIPVPPKCVQDRIADYLDRETARLDALVAAKERVLGLLAEKRRAVITRAVTRGHSVDVPMKESGISWLGRVPAHWQVSRLKYLVTKIEQGWSPECDNREAAADEWGVVKAGCVNFGRFVEAEHKALPSTLDPVPELEIRPGDLLMSRASGSRDLVGSVALVGECRARLLLCDKVFRLHVDQHSSPRFLAYTLNSRIARWQIETELSGGNGMANNIAQEVVREIVVPHPGLREQEKIADFLDAALTRLDRVTTATERSIALIKERRVALISAAVTGALKIA